MKKSIILILLLIIFGIVISNVAIATETGIVTTTTIRLRREANTSSDVLELIGEGTELEILDEEDGWYKVEYEGLTGYVSSDYISVSNNNSTNTTSNSNSSLTSTNTNTVSESDSTNTDSDNVITNTENNIDESTQTNETSENSQSIEFTLTNDANIKSIPSFTSTTISTISKGTDVTVVDTLNNWVKITDGISTGWVIRQNVD